MQEQQPLSKFDFNLTSQDEKNIKAFHTLLKMDKILEFSSDDFRRYGLDRFIRDPQHGIGAFFAKLKKHGYIQETGFTRSMITSNNMHTIRLYIWGKEP